MKQQKQEKERTYNIYEDSESDSESSEEELYIAKKPSKYKKHAPTKGGGRDFPKEDHSEISELKGMVKMLMAAQLKAKKKRPAKKQINLQLPAYAAPVAAQPRIVNQKMESLAQRLINI